jgi:hypothetical protein
MKTENEPVDDFHRPLEGFSPKSLSYYSADIQILAEAHDWPGFYSFITEHPHKWFSAERGLSLFRPLVEHIRAELAGESSTPKPRGRGVYLPVAKHMEPWSRALDVLDAWIQVLEAARAQQRRFRIEIDS